MAMAVYGLAIDCYIYLYDIWPFIGISVSCPFSVIGLLLLRRNSSFSSLGQARQCVALRSQQQLSGH